MENKLHQDEEPHFLKKRIYNVCVDVLTEQDKELLKQGTFYRLRVNPPQLNLLGWNVYKGKDMYLFEVPFADTGKFGYRKFIGKNLDFDSCLKVFEEEIGFVKISKEELG